MLLDDQFDIGYKFLAMVLALGCLLIVGSGIIGYFFTKKRKQRHMKYQMIGFLLISIISFITDLTYLIPSCIVFFVDLRGFCNILGAIQSFTENVVSFFTIGISVNILCMTYPKYRECRCKKRRDASEIILYSWSTVGFVYCSSFLFFELFADVMGPRGNRCWIVKGPGNLTVTEFQFIAWRTPGFISAAVAVICAILSNVQLKKMKKEIEKMYLTSDINNSHNYRDALQNLVFLNKSLLKKFIIFFLFVFAQVGVSPIYDAAVRSGRVNDSNSMYFGWMEGIYIISGTAVGLTFDKGFVDNFVDALHNIRLRRRTSRDDSLLVKTVLNA